MKRLFVAAIRLRRVRRFHGRRSSWKEIRAMTPVDSVYNLRITPDGRAYAYNYTHASSDLFLVDGLK